MEQGEVERLIGELEVAVDRLRSLYEQYFMGIEKLEPTVPRKDVDRRIHVLRKEQIRNTALRFRFQMLLQRYNTYQTHWQRICRDIENGTYKRHVIRAQRRFGIKRASVRPSPVADASIAAELAELDREFSPAETLDDKDVELDEGPDEAPPSVRRRPPSSRGASARPPPSTPRAIPPPRTPAPTRTPAPPRTPPPRTPLPAPQRADARAAGPPTPRGIIPPPQSSARAPTAPPSSRPPVASARRPREPELPEERVRQLYAQYIEAKRRQRESTAAITYDAVAKSLRESSAKLRQRHGRNVDFEVAIKDGRAIIRPVLK